MKDEKINNICGERLKKCLKEKKMKQYELAEKINITSEYVSMLVNGVRPMNPYIAHSISKILGVSEGYLLGETDFVNMKEELDHKEHSMTKLDKCINELFKELGYTFKFEDNLASKTFLNSYIDEVKELEEKGCFGEKKVDPFLLKSAFDYGKIVVNDSKTIEALELINIFDELCDYASFLINRTLNKDKDRKMRHLSMRVYENNKKYTNDMEIKDEKLESVTNSYDDENSLDDIPF